MDYLPAILGFIVALVVSWLVASPLLLSAAPERDESDVVREKERLLQTLEDLELEHRSGKLADAEYHSLRQEALTAAARLQARLESRTDA